MHIGITLSHAPLNERGDLIDGRGFAPVVVVPEYPINSEPTLREHTEKGAKEFVVGGHRCRDVACHQERIALLPSKNPRPIVVNFAKNGTALSRTAVC